MIKESERQYIAQVLVQDGSTYVPIGEHAASEHSKYFTQEFYLLSLIWAVQIQIYRRGYAHKYRIKILL